MLVVGWLYARDAPVRAGLALDAQHHLAGVRELAKGEFPPRHNLVEGPYPQGHYGPYLVVLGALSRWTGLDPRVVLYGAGLVNLALFAMVFRSTVRRFVTPSAGRWSVAAFLLLWGPWPWLTVAWPSRGWPGTTSLADVQNFFYPQQAGLILLLVMLILADRLRTPGAGGRRGNVVMILLAAAALVATHPLTGLAMAVALAAFVASERSPRLLWLLLVPAGAMLLAALWPYYPVLGLLQAAAHPGLREPLPEWLSSSAPPAAVAAAAASDSVTTASPPSLPFLSIAGPALAGAVWGVHLLARGRSFLLVWSALNLVLSWCPFLPLRHRFALFAVLPLQIAATGLLESAWRKGQAGKAAVVLLLGAGALSAAPRLAWVLGQERPDLSFVERFVPEDGVVLSDPSTANGVAGLTGRKVVASQNPDLFLVASGGWQRTLDVHRFLGPRTPDEARLQILRRWRVTHVLVDRLWGGTAPALPYPMVHEGGGYVLYDVRDVVSGN